MAFTSLRVWRDLDQDGVSDAGELFSLADLGIASINANGSALNVVSPSGVTLRERSTFRACCEKVESDFSQKSMR